MAAQASQAAFAGNEPGQVREGPVGPVGEQLFHLGVAAVVGFGLDGRERGAGEHGVVAPDGEQFVLALGGRAVQVFDPADEQPGGDGRPFFEVKAVYCASATSAAATQQRSWSSQIARGYLSGSRRPRRWRRSPL